MRVLSSYSLGLGLSPPAEICRHARRVGFDTVALTDVSGTFGFVEFHRAAREVGVKPVYGTLLFVDWSNPPSAGDPAQSLIMLALDRSGLRHVCAAATISAMRRERGEGLFVEDLDGLTDGVLAIAGLDLHHAEADVRHVLHPLREFFRDRLFVECRDGLNEADVASQTALLRDARAAGVGPVLVQDVRFVGPARPQLADLVPGAEDASYEHRVFSDPRAGGAGAHHGMRTAADMSAAYEAMPEAHANAALVASLVQPDLFDAVEETMEPSPATDMFNAANELRATLRARVRAARERRSPTGAADSITLEDVVEKELSRIERTGIGDRFLQYEEITRRLRESGVEIGPATGLSVQSRCAWLLGITAFDPYSVDDRFDPEFETRVGETRVLDLQIAPEQRARVLATLNNAYDDASIGYVPSVEHVTASRAMRIAARRLEIPQDEFDEGIRIAGRHPGMSLRELSEDSRSLGMLYRRSAAFRDLVAHAASIEGLPFGFSRTKRTIVVSPRSLRGMFAYTVNPETGDHFIQSPRDSFPIGDIRRIDVDALHILAWVGAGDGVWDATDPAPYRLVASGDLDGVHLLEGRPGSLAPEFGIAAFDDLVHFVALLRHRATGTTFAERLRAFRGEPAAVAAADLVGDIVARSNGWVLFRDQVRDILARLTGLELQPASDLVSRFRDYSPGSLAALRREFLRLTVEMSVPLDDATAWFARFLRLASHAQERQQVLAECLLIHRCLAFKMTDRTLFFARLLDHTASAEKRRRYHELLEAEGAWLPPDVNRSGRRHRVEGGRIRPPLWDVSGVSREAADGIVRMRGDHRYASIEEFRGAVDGAGVNPDVVDALVRAGAFESVVEKVTKKERRRRRKPAVAGAPEQLRMDLARSAAEERQESHAAPVDGPPPRNERRELGPRRMATTAEFHPSEIGSRVELAGQVRGFHRFRTDAGKSVGYFELFDDHGTVRVFMPAGVGADLDEALENGVRAVVRGQVRMRDGRKVCDALEVVVGVPQTRNMVE